MSVNDAQRSTVERDGGLTVPSAGPDVGTFGPVSFSPRVVHVADVVSMVATLLVICGVALGAVFVAFAFTAEQMR